MFSLLEGGGEIFSLVLDQGEEEDRGKTEIWRPNGRCNLLPRPGAALLSFAGASFELLFRQCTAMMGYTSGGEPADFGFCDVYVENDYDCILSRIEILNILRTLDRRIESGDL